jgi:hypothetical protein
MSAVFKPWLILLTCLLASFSLQAQWLCFDTDQGNYTPFTGEEHTEVLHLVVNVQQLRGSFLGIQTKEESRVWVNHQLKTGLAKEHVLDLHVLKSTYGQEFTISFSKAGGWKASSLPVLRTGYTASGAIPPDSTGGASLKAWQLDRFISPALVLWLILVAVFKANYPKIWNEYYNPAAVFLRRINQDALIQARQFNPGTLWALGLSGYQLVFAFMIYLPRLQGYPPLLDRLFHPQAGLMLLTLLIGSLALMITFFLKFIFIRFLTGLFGFSSFAGYHFFDYLRLSSIIYSAFILIGLVLHWQETIPGEELLNSLLWLFLGLLVFRVLYLMARLLATTNLQFSYLFSYLCTTEIIPLALGIHWILEG